jgi:hypothetical protein
MPTGLRERPAKRLAPDAPKPLARWPALLSLAPVQKLGLNHGGYRGESLPLADVLDAILQAATLRHWLVDRRAAGDAGDLVFLRRPAPVANPGPRFYLSAGIHGDEPAGPLALLQLLREDRWPPGSALWLCPCLNPSGFARNRRENGTGLDLNRDYRNPQSSEVQIHTAWLERQPAFDLALCLHEDWEAHGFYLYELNPDSRPTRAEHAIAAVERVCPIDPSAVIEGRPARGGVIRPELNAALRPDWPEAFYLIQHKTRHSYTLEAPSDFALATRVNALVTAVECLIQERTPAQPPATDGRPTGNRQP